MTTCDMPLGPRTGSKPAGSAEKAALRTPPRRGAASARDDHPSTRGPPVAAIRDAAAVPPRNRRRLKGDAPKSAASAALAATLISSRVIGLASPLYGAHVEAPRRSSVAQLQFIRFFIHGLVQYERYAMPFTLVNASTLSPRSPAFGRAARSANVQRRQKNINKRPRCVWISRIMTDPRSDFWEWDMSPFGRRCGSSEAVKSASAPCRNGAARRGEPVRF